MSQPAIRPLVVTENAIVPYSYDVGACTTHPDFFLRFRAYISTISICTISEREWWPYESMLLMADMVFYFINCRPDGKKPTMDCLLSTFLAMFGDYATTLQNDGLTMEAFFKARTWTQLWKESISAFDEASGSKRNRAADSGNSSVALPTDIANMRDMNNTFLKSMQSSIDKRFKSLQGGAAAAPAKATASADDDDAPPRKVYKGKKGGRGGSAKR